MCIKCNVNKRDIVGGVGTYRLRERWGYDVIVSEMICMGCKLQKRKGDVTITQKTPVLCG